MELSTALELPYPKTLREGEPSAAKIYPVSWLGTRYVDKFDARLTYTLRLLAR
jgi:hypothetical protein